MSNLNVKETYVDGDDPWSGFLSEAALEINSIANRLKGYSPGKLVFGRNMILPIKHKADLESISQQKQAHSNKYNIR